jgi:hypothetical protein
VSESWKTVKADQVRVGDTVRTATGDVVTVSKIEHEFMGRPEMLAFIEDTPQRWYKRPVASSADVEVSSAM